LYCSRFFIIAESSYDEVIFKKLQKIKSYCPVTSSIEILFSIISVNPDSRTSIPSVNISPIAPVFSNGSSHAMRFRPALFVVL